MNSHTFSRVAKKFISDETNKVFLLKGEWGSGKTYLWNNFIKTNKGDITGSDRYSYISLFGKNSINDISQSIFFESLSIDDIGNTNINTQSKIKKVLKYLNSVRGRVSVGGFSLSNVSSLITSSIVASVGTQNMLLCFDDLERMSDNIDVQDFLGFILNLKEQKECKILIICNDKKLSQKSHEALKILNEKVIDIELSYNPSLYELSSIVFSDIENEYKDYFLERFEALKISNLRILFKIKKSWEEIKKEVPQNLHKWVIQSIILLAHSHYGNPEKDPKNEIPGLDMIMNVDGPFGSYLKERMNPNSSSDSSEFYQTWRSKLMEYGWYKSYKIDHEILFYVQNGFLQDTFSRSITEALGKLDSEKAIKLQSDIWGMLHGPFVDSSKDIIQKINTLICEYGSFISLSDCSSFLKILKALGKSDQYLEEIIDHYLNANKHQIKSLYFSVFPGDPKSELLETRLQEFIQRNTSFYSLLEIVDLYSKKKQYDREKAQKSILKASVDDIYIKLFVP